MHDQVNKQSKTRSNASLHIGLSVTGLTLVHSSGWLRKQRIVLADRRYCEADLVLELRSLLTEFACDGLRVTITLADALVRMWNVTPPQNTVSLSDCQAASAARFQILYGQPISDWEMVADWHAQKPFVACAMPRKLLDALKSVAHAHRLSLLEIAPQFVVTWNRWRAEISAASWLGVVHENVLTIGAIHQRRLCAIRAMPLPPDAGTDPAWLPRYLKREALRLNLAAPAQLQLCGAVPTLWSVQAPGATQAADSLVCKRLDMSKESAVWSAGAALAHAGVPGRF